MIISVKPTRMCGGRVRPFYWHLKPRRVRRYSMVGRFMTYNENGTKLYWPPGTPETGGLVFDALGVGIFWEYA